MFLGVFATFLLVSCGGQIKPNTGGDPTDPSQDPVDPTDPDAMYKFTEAQFNYEISRDTVLFKSNYTITAYRSSVEYMVSEFDYGKCKSTIQGNTSYYKLVDKGSNVELTSYYNSQPYTQTITKEQLYSYFFTSLNFLFDIKYSDLTFSSTYKRYELSDVDLGDYHINSGYISGYNRKPMTMSFDIQGFGTVSAVFTNHGTTSVTLPA